MGHDTNHGSTSENKTIISFKNSFWLVVIIVGLFVAALNFVKAESGGEEGEGKKEATEMKATPAGEKGEKKAEEAPKGEAAKEAPAKEAK